MSNYNYTVIDGVLNANHAWDENGWGSEGITSYYAQRRAQMKARLEGCRRIVLCIGSRMAMHGVKNSYDQWVWLRHQDLAAFLRETPTALADSCLFD